MLTFKQFLESNNYMKRDSRITDEGFYSAVTPNSKSIKILKEVCEQLNVELTKDVHCSVMYSTTCVDSAQARKFSKQKYVAFLDHIEFWDGHDHAGYLVLKLKSDDLVEEHNRLKQLGCKYTFDKYTPHITLVTPYKLKDKNILKEVNDNLKHRKIVLINQKIDILKL